MPLRLRHIRVGMEEGDVRGADNRAIQIAINALGAAGGTVEVLPGEYVCIDAVHLASGIRLVGHGDKTVLKRADGFRMPIRIGADYGQLKITPVDIKPFRVGQGLYVQGAGSRGWLDSVVTIDSIEGSALHFSDPLVMNYSEEEGGEVLASGSVVSGRNVEDVAVEALTVEGNKDKNFPVGGCRAGGIYFHRSSRVTMSDVAVHDFNGDGITFQITRDFRLERISSCGCTSIGVHPGTGSARVVMTDGVFRDNDVDGCFLCWRVQEGRFERLVCEGNGRAGLNVGHRDTDNVFTESTFRGNGRAGILFRAENANNGGHRNTFERCLIEDNNGPGIEVEGHVYDILFRECTIRETRGEKGRQRVGLVLGPEARRFATEGCTWQGHAEGNVRDSSGKKGSHNIDAPKGV